MLWDAVGNRVRLTSSTDQSYPYYFVYDATAGIPAVIEEVHDGDSVFYVREPGGALIARFAGATTNYYGFDELGNTLFLTASNGTVSDKYTYDAWGNVTSHTGSTNQPYQFVGKLGYYTHWQDSNIGDLLQLGVRYYAPGLGRFTQRDPIRIDKVTDYAYALDNPCHTTDPTGLFPRFRPGMGRCCSIMNKQYNCWLKWKKWWPKHTGPWDKKHPPKYGPNQDKVGHCFVACKGIKDCGLTRIEVITGGFIKECIDYIKYIGDDFDDQAANKLGADIAEKPDSQCLRDCLRAVDKKWGGVPGK